MVAMVLQVLLTSIFIAGVWIADLSLPTKMIVVGAGGSIYFFLQYQLVGFLEVQAKEMAELKAWIRVLESSLELARLNPSSTDSAREIVLNEVKRESQVSAFEERMSPTWWVNLFALLIGVVLAIGVAWLWVLLLPRHV